MSLREFFVLLNHLSGNSVYIFRISPIIEKHQNRANTVSNPIEMEQIFDNWGK